MFDARRETSKRGTNRNRLESRAKKSRVKCAAKLRKFSGFLYWIWKKDVILHRQKRQTVHSILGGVA